MNDSLERIVDLEMRFMKLERELHELSDVVVSQQRVIDALKLEAQRWRARGRGDEDVPRHEKPPHY